MKVSFKDASVAKLFIEELNERSVAHSMSLNESEKLLEVDFEIDISKAKEQMIASVCGEEKKSVSVSELDSLVSNVYRSIMSELEWYNKWTNERINDLEIQLANHNKGHLPPILGASRLEKAMEALGISGDFVVEKQTIRA